MRKPVPLTLALFFAVCVSTGINTTAQEPPDPEPAKIEIGIQFSSLNLGRQVVPFSVSAGFHTSEPGGGGRFGYNLTKSVAFEAEVNFFPNVNGPALNSGGRLLQGQFGTKIGKRFDKFGLFAKVRPGFLSFGDILTQTGTQTFTFNGQTFTFPILEPKRRNFFSLDVGGVVEFYPSRRVLVRFDVGDTMVHVGKLPEFPFTQARLVPRVAHKFQFSSGIAFRFLNPEPADSSDTHTSRSERKFEAGAQFSSLGFSIFNHFPRFPFDGTSELVSFGTVTEVGFGGRLTYNITPSFGVELQTDFYPASLPTFADGGAGGKTLQFQGGAKVGRRFEKFGVFGKARPGVISFDQTAIFDRVDPSQILFPVQFRPGRSSHFSLDVGGVLEFYPSPRIVTRFDGGDTMIRFGERISPIFSTQSPQTSPSRLTHNFQFSAGVGFRF